MALIDQILKSCQVDVIPDYEVRLCTEPSKVDSPKEILEKYARGIPLYGYNPTFQSDDIDDDDKLLDSGFFEDEFDQRQFIKDYGEQHFQPSTASETPVNERTEKVDTVTASKEETPA